MATENDLERKVEEAVIAWIASTATHGITLGLTPTHGDASAEIDLPAVFVHAHDAEEYPVGSYCHRVSCDVILRVQADDTTAAAAEVYWGNIRDIFNWSALPAALSAALSEFYCYGVLQTTGTSHDRDDRSWLKRLTLTVMCMAQDNV